MEYFSFAQFPPGRSIVGAALYTEVTNAAAIRRRIIEAAVAQGEEGELEREAVNFAFIDARLVGDPIYASHPAILRACGVDYQSTTSTDSSLSGDAS